jgi:predicted PilT family ATPase
MATNNNRKFAVKFLLSNSLTGLLIGTEGKTIKEVIRISDAKVIVSGITEHFPGTNLRVVIIVGTLEQVSLASTFIWEMLAIISKSENLKNVTWSPSEVSKNFGQNEEALVTSKIAIPAAAAGAVLGKKGEGMKSIVEESEAKIIMTTKEEALFTQERVITLSGTCASCIRGSDYIFQCLAEQEDIYSFANRGTTYSANPYAERNAARLNGKNGKVDGRAKKQEDESVPQIADSTITFNIEDKLIGNVLGKQGANIREIISISGATVEISKRGEFAEGTTSRIITIKGTAKSTQAAHSLITQRMEHPTVAPLKARAPVTKA